LIPDISITVSGRNAEGLPEIIDWVLARDLPFSLNFYRQNDFSVSHTNLKLKEEKIIDGILAAFSTYPKIALSAVPRAAYSQKCGGDLSHIFLRRGRVPFGYGAGSILKYFSDRFLM